MGGGERGPLDCPSPLSDGGPPPSAENDSILAFVVAPTGLSLGTRPPGISLGPP